VTPSGEHRSRRASGRLARSARALAASWRRRATARATPAKAGEAKRTAEDERVMISQRFDAARERLKASIAPPAQDDQRSTDETERRSTGDAPPPSER
jgi:hypothetical protein